MNSYTYLITAYELVDIDSNYYGVREIAVPTNIVARFSKAVVPTITLAEANSLKLQLPDGELVLTGYASLAQINADIALINSYVVLNASDATAANQLTQIALETSIDGKLAVTGLGNLRVAVQEPLPAGSNVIGSVDINSSVELEVTNDVGNPLNITGTVDLGNIGNVATATNQATQILYEGTIANGLGGPLSAPAADDTGAWSLVSLFKRYLQRFTAFLSLIPASLTGSGNFRVAVQEALPAGSNTIGTVNIGTIPEVEIKNDVGNPVPISGTVGISGTPTVNIGTIPEVEIKNDVGNPIPVNGTVSVGNFPATQNVSVVSSVEVEVRNDTGNPIPVNGTVSVGNFPANQNVTITSPTSFEIANDVGSPIPTSSIDGAHVTIGARGDAAASNDTGAFSLMAFIKRTLQRITDIINNQSSMLTYLSQSATAANQGTMITLLNSLFTSIGNIGDPPAGSDVAFGNVIQYLKRISGRITTLISLFPTSLTGSGNFRTAILEALPAGSNTIGTVNIGTIPEVEIKNDVGNPIPVSGTFSYTPSGTQDVNIVSSIELEVKNDVGNPVPISASSLPLPTGASTAANQTTIDTSINAVNTSVGTLNTNFGAQADAAAGSDAGTFSYMSLFKRLLAKFTTQFPSALTGLGNFKVSIEEGTVNVGTLNGSVSVIKQAISNSNLVILPANASRQFLLIHNQSTSATLYFDIGGPATINSYRLTPGATIIYDGGFIPTNNVQVLGTTLSQMIYMQHA